MNASVDATAARRDFWKIGDFSTFITSFFSLTRLTDKLRMIMELTSIVRTSIKIFTLIAKPS